MKSLFSLFILLFSANSYSQSSFVKGYFIDNAGQRTECLINDADWDLNPSEIKYKLDDNSSIQQADITKVREFGSETEYLFKRFTVAIDESNNGQISDSRDFVYKTKTIYLKEIVSGSANLYSCNDSGLIKYFFNTNNNDIPVQLEYKRYSYGSEIFQNINFKQQLFNKLKNDKVSQSDFDKLEYKSSSLIKLFEKYNGNQGKTTKKVFRKSMDFNLYLKAGFQSNSFNADSNNAFTGEFDFDNASGAKFGVEAEIVFPSKNKNNFAAYIEVSNSSFNGDLTKSFGKVHMEYTTIEAGLGIKYYFGISDSSKLFISGGALLPVSQKSEFTMENFIDAYSNFKKTANFNFGIGYKFKNKVTVAISTTTPRALIDDSEWDSEFKSSYIMVGYNFL